MVSLENERRWAGWIWTYCAGFFRDGHGGSAWPISDRAVSIGMSMRRQLAAMPVSGRFGIETFQ
jgi:hypothetical protein